MRTLIAFFLLAAAGCDSTSEAETYTTVLYDDQQTAINGFDLVVVIPAPGEAGTGLQVNGARTASPREEPVRISRAADGEITFSLDAGVPDSGTDLVGFLSSDGTEISGVVIYTTIAGPRQSGTFKAERR